MDAITSNEIIGQMLNQGNAAIGTQMKADVIAIYAPMGAGLDDAVKNEVENLKEEDDETGMGEKPYDRLVVILETGGGYIEVVERIVSVFRRHYKFVEFIIPNFAYSAGTVLALSGDEIHMSYYSVLGPIDPQFKTENGRSVPGMGYIAKYNSLMQKINSVKDAEIGTVRAEMTFLLKKFDPAEVFQIEQAIRHSQELLEQWLPKYKFKNWKNTDSGKRVTAAYRRKRAEKIAKVLGDAEHWHSHGRGISIAELQSEKIGLKVNDFGDNAALNNNIAHYHGLLSDYMIVSGFSAAIHTRHRLRRVA